jgi:glycogen(starch) synthase
MRILMSADTVGGVWSYALELARGLTEAGDEVVIAAMGGRLDAGQRRAADAVAGLVVHDRELRLEWMDDPWDDLDHAADWLLALAAEVEPDVVHLNHYAHGTLDWPAPTLVVAHSCVYSWYCAVRGRAPEPRWSRYRQVVQRGLRAADLVAAPTVAMLAEAARFYGPFRAARVLHNGRRPQDFTPHRKRRQILSAGRLWDDAKNIRALTAVAPTLPWPVVVAGDRRHPDGGESHLAGVRALGRLDQAAMAGVLGESAIYALPARYEPFGLSVLEAALAGCALVLGDVPSLRELWDGAALFVEPWDEDGLRSALIRLCEDSELRHAYAERARDRAQQYSTDVMVDGYRSVYRQLQEERSAARRKAQGGRPCAS